MHLTFTVGLYALSIYFICKPGYTVEQLVEAQYYKSGYTVEKLVETQYYKPGYTVEQLVEAQYYKPELRGVDSQ
jgi:hypothetical protein